MNYAEPHQYDRAIAEGDARWGSRSVCRLASDAAPAAFAAAVRDLYHYVQRNCTERIKPLNPAVQWLPSRHRYYLTDDAGMPVKTHGFDLECDARDVLVTLWCHLKETALEPELASAEEERETALLAA